MSSIMPGRLLGSMTPRDRRALGIVGGFLFAIAAYTQLIEPLVFRFESALERRDRAEHASSGYTQKIRMLPRREHRLAELEREMSTLSAYFAPDVAAQSAPTESLIDELTAYASISGVRLRQLVPDVETLPDAQGRIHDLELTGDYPSLRRYLYLLETSPRRFDLAELEMSPPKEGGSRIRVRFFDPAPTSSPSGAPSGVEPLMIGVYGTADDLPVYVAREAGDFATAEVVVNLMPAGSPQLSLSRLLSGELDAVVASLYDIMRYRLAGVPLQVVMPLGQLPLATSLVTETNSGVDVLAALAGKTLGLESHGMAEVLLLQLLFESGMSRSDIDIVYLDRRAMVRHLKSGLVDAVLVSGLNKAGLAYLGLKEIERFAAGNSDWQSYLVAHADSLSRFPRRWQAVATALFATAKRLQAKDPSAVELADNWLRYRNTGAAASALSEVRFIEAAQAGQLLGSDADFGLDPLQDLLLELGEEVPDTSRDELVNEAWLQATLEHVGDN